MYVGRTFSSESIYIYEHKPIITCSLKDTSNPSTEIPAECTLQGSTANRGGRPNHSDITIKEHWGILHLKDSIVKWEASISKFSDRFHNRLKESG